MGIEAALIGAMAAISAVGTAASIQQGKQGAKAQDEALKRQEQMQRQAMEQAQTQQRRSEMATNAATRRTPDTASIMQRAAAGAAGGPSGTMLTGPGGVNPSGMSLGRSSLLGE